MGFDKKRIKMICLVGVACTGKTTYMNGIAGLNDKYETEKWYGGKRPATLSVGDIFRDTLGSEFFKDLPRPYAPDITANMVKQLVHEFVHISYETGIGVIVDGFPRTKEQLEWLMNSSYVSMRPVDVEIRFLYANEDDLIHRRAERIAKCETEEAAAALRQRFECDKESFIKVYERTTKMIKSDQHNGFTMREIEV